MRRLTVSSLASLTLVAALSGCAVASRAPASDSAPATTAQTVADDGIRDVEYYVYGQGDAGAAITLRDTDGVRQFDSDLPMRGSDGQQGVKGTVEAGQALYISAQNRGDWGSVECKIIVDGVEVSRVESIGAYKIASCDAVAD